MPRCFLPYLVLVCFGWQASRLAKRVMHLLYEFAFFLLLLTWAGSMWHIRHHGEDTGTADANFLADDQDGDAHPDDPLELWHHPARSR